MRVVVRLPGQEPATGFAVRIRFRWVLAQPSESAVARFNTSHRRLRAAVPWPPHGEYAAGCCPHPASWHWASCLARLAASASLRCLRAFSRFSGNASRPRGLVTVKSTHTSRPLSHPTSKTSAGRSPLATDTSTECGCWKQTRCGPTHPEVSYAGVACGARLPTGDKVITKRVDGFLALRAAWQGDPFGQEGEAKPKPA